MISKLFEKRSEGALAKPSVPITGSTLVEAPPDHGHGEHVDENSALALSSVWACVKVIAESVASLPMHVYEKGDDGRERRDDHPVVKLLDRPNPYQTPFTFWENAAGHLLLWGNAYFEVVRNGAGRVVELLPLDPRNWEPRIDEAGEKWLVRRGKEESEGFPPTRFIHIPAFGDGVEGMSPIRTVERTIGITMAAEGYGARFFGQGAALGGVLKSPSPLRPEVADRLRRQFEDRYHRKGAQHRTLVLEDGLSWERVGIPPEEAQFLQTRKFGVEEVARIYRVPLHLIGHLDRMTYSNVEQLGIDFTRYTLRPWLKRIEDTLNFDLFTAQERGRVYVEFSVDGLLRGDVKSRYEAYQTAIVNGWMTRDEVRALENMNPLPDGMGALPLTPLNMAVGGEPIEDEPKEGTNDPEMGTEEGSEDRALARPWTVRSRENIQSTMEKTIATVIGRYTKTEAKVVKELVDKLEAGTISLDEFYSRLKRFQRSQADGYTDDFAAILTIFAASVIEDITIEIGKPATFSQLPTFSRDYANTFVTSEQQKTFNTVKKILSETGEGVDPFSEMKRVADLWPDSRVTNTATNQATRAVGAIAREVYRESGVTHLRWVTSPGNCPLCASLEGKVVGIREWFVAKGESVYGGEDTETLVSEQNIGHPPLHRGCRCSIVAD